MVPAVDDVELQALVGSQRALPPALADTRSSGAMSWPRRRNGTSIGVGMTELLLERSTA